MSIPEPVYEAFLVCPFQGCGWRVPVDFPDEDAAHHGDYFEHFRSTHIDSPGSEP